ncbi:MAG: hypothetical protein WCF96_05915 [Eubacteriales bacterium]
MTKKDKIEWLGIDGLLIGGFFVICSVIFASLVYKIDIISGYIIPFTILAIVTAIFIRYLFTVYQFIKTSGNTKKE